MYPGVFQETVRWVLHNGYWLMFLLMLVEGPAVTAAGAFGAALGYFNVWTILALSVLGNLIPDVVYYAIGFWGRRRVVDKYGHYFKITKERLEGLEKLAKEHAWKALTIIKLVPLLATPGLIAVGSARMPIKKYVWISLAITVPSSLLFLVVGYYFGEAYDKISGYVDYGGYVAFVLLTLIVLASVLWKKFSKRVAGKIEKI